MTVKYKPTKQPKYKTEMKDYKVVHEYDGYETDVIEELTYTQACNHSKRLNMGASDRESYLVVKM